MYVHDCLSHPSIHPSIRFVYPSQKKRINNMPLFPSRFGKMASCPYIHRAIPAPASKKCAVCHLFRSRTTPPPETDTHPIHPSNYMPSICPHPANREPKTLPAQSLSLPPSLQNPSKKDPFPETKSQNKARSRQSKPSISAHFCNPKTGVPRRGDINSCCDRNDSSRPAQNRSRSPKKK